MRVFKPSAESIQEVSQLLLRGEVVAIPTETVYGLAADALNVAAVEEIYQIKGRPAYNPLIIHVHDLSSAEQFCFLNDVARKLAHTFWPGPLTIVLPKRSVIPSIVSAGLDTIGIRVPKHPVMQSVLKETGHPLAAPSANPSNYISPSKVEHVVDSLTGKLKYAVDGGACPNGVESTIVDACNPDKIILLRPGPITRSEIESVIERSVYEKLETQENAIEINSPGQLKTHYSPNKRISIETSPSSKSNSAKIHFYANPDRTDGASDFYLTRNGNHREAEANLYALMQELDKSDFEEIIVDPIPSGEAWNALSDRLTRAAHQ